MQTVTTIGLDIAKSVFQVHGVDAAGQVVIRRQLKRRYVLAFFQKLSPAWRRAISRSTAFRTKSVLSSSGASTAAICSKVPSGNFAAITSCQRFFRPIRAILAGTGAVIGDLRALLRAHFGQP